VKPFHKIQDVGDCGENVARIRSAEENVSPSGNMTQLPQEIIQRPGSGGANTICKADEIHCEFAIDRMWCAFFLFKIPKLCSH